MKLKKIKDNNGEFIKEPVTCSVCKKKNAFFRMNGFPNHRGHTCCEPCGNRVRNNEKAKARNERRYETEGENQAYRMYGLR